MGAAPAPEVNTLVPPYLLPGPLLRSLEEWQRGEPVPARGGHGGLPRRPPPPAGPALAFRRSPVGG